MATRFANAPAITTERRRISLAACAIATLLVLTSPVAAQQPAAAAAIPVVVSPASLQPVAPALEFVGRVEAVEKVEVRARVTGILQQVLFKEGGVVAAGAPLFRIERDTFEAAVQSAQGDLIKSQGQYSFAQVQRQRAEDLVKTAATAVQTRDQRVAEEKTAEGQMVAATAAYRQAQINLGYTDINAPIAGEIGRALFNVGSLVGPDSGPLTTIVSVDPIYAAFPVSQREFLALRQAGQANTDAVSAAVKVRLFFSDGSEYDKEGTVNFIDVTVDRRTDTVLVRATMPNPNGILVDGQLVRVVVEGKKPDEKVVVPQAALITDQQGPYVFVVVDGKAEVRRLKLGAEKGSDTVVESGLNGGEQVVVQGLQSLRPGAAVIASPLAPSGRS